MGEKGDNEPLLKKFRNGSTAAKVPSMDTGSGPGQKAAIQQ
jgi:hypothetical protein